LAVRSPRQGKSRAARNPARHNAAVERDEIVARAARLGITVERVLRELANIAFHRPMDVVEFKNGALLLKHPDDWPEEAIAAVHEIVPGDAGHVRIKFYDKKPALDALARHLEMMPAPPRRPEAPPQDVSDNEGEDPREFLYRELARLAGDTAEAGALKPDEPEGGG
jgi:hypothetical protein